MIKIQLKLFVTLAKYLPENAQEYPLDEGTSIEDLITDLGLPREEVKLIFVNGRKTESSYLLQDNDRLGLFPPVGGG
ncbi:MAG: MoaD/ThiS family protein [Desulfobacterales bacterium]|nr:MoaD/ThiS family protein [Desulfobacterales bacterium]